jgi:ureidoglycolate lyase
MSRSELTPLPITAERFARFGDVIDDTATMASTMNDARFDRFADQARIDIDGQAAVSVVRSCAATTLPYEVGLLERHPLGSQAFVPLEQFSFVVVVAPPGESIDAAQIRAFLVGPGQGVNYLRGTWHMPLVAMQLGQAFLVIDRAAGAGPNCEERALAEPVFLIAP